MTITKYLHSCVLLEEDGFKLLFDPGTFVFVEGLFKPADLPKPDVVLITHGHPDHYD
ncbi:MAG: MBL fold metallo-hydrolase, partial [Candidatus Kerfeldbacteria bacterium]|nr:MBL fold metallo-hydrolase [Candidatus Kerfeldbacteria bacterium]